MFPPQNTKEKCAWLKLILPLILFFRLGKAFDITPGKNKGIHFSPCLLLKAPGRQSVLYLPKTDFPLAEGASSDLLYQGGWRLGQSNSAVSDFFSLHLRPWSTYVQKFPHTLFSCDGKKRADALYPLLCHAIQEHVNFDHACRSIGRWASSKDLCMLFHTG